MLLSFILPLFLFAATECRRSHYMDDGVVKYLQCINEKLGFVAEAIQDDYFKDISFTNNHKLKEVCKFVFTEEKVGGEMIRKGDSDTCKPLSPTQEMANRNSGLLKQRFEETITITKSSENTSSSEVTISAEASASMSTVKEVGAKAGVSDTSGKEKTRRSEMSTTQKWERNYVIPGFMKSTADMLQCDRLVDIPEVTVWTMQGCLPISFQMRGDGIYLSDEEWKECGEVPIGYTGSHTFVFRYSNFKDEWKDDGKGGLTKTWVKSKLLTIPFTKFQSKVRILSDEAADRKYCKALRPQKNPKSIEQETLQEEDEVEEITEEEKDLSDFSWDVDIIFEDAEPGDDDDDQQKKKKDKCKGKNTKKCNKMNQQKKPKGKKPGRRAKKAKQTSRRPRG